MLLVLEEVGRSFLCCLNGVHNDFWQAVRYNIAIPLSFVAVYLSKLLICSLFQLQSNLSSDYLKEYKICWLTPALRTVTGLGMWHPGWLGASNSSCRTLQTALSSKFTLFFKCYFSVSGGAASLHKCEETGLCILRSLKHHSGFPVLLDLRNKTVRPNPCSKTMSVLCTAA